MKLEVAKKTAEEMIGTSFHHIKPVLGGRNSRIFHLKNSEGSFALKFFRTDANKVRDRFDAEISALNLFAENGLKCVPKLVAQDRGNNCIMMEWIDGETITDFIVKEINAISSFLKTIHGISKQNNNNHIRFATEACLNGNQIVTQMKRRSERLESAGETHPELQEFLDEDFIPAFKKITDWSRKEYLKNNMDFDQDISLEKLTLSPVDIGFHNCLRTENQLYFLDFEFFGRDDPVKLVADTLQHPGSILSPKDNGVLRNKLEILFRDDDDFSFRLNCLYPLFGLKWCMIMLNPFLPNYDLNGLKNMDIKRIRFKQVKQKLDRINSLITI